MVSLGNSSDSKSKIGCKESGGLDLQFSSYQRMNDYLHKVVWPLKTEKITDGAARPYSFGPAGLGTGLLALTWAEWL